MKLYKITAKTTRNIDVSSDFKSTKWAGSQTEAAKARKEFMDRGFKRAELDTQDVEVPTNKDGLLNWLNLNCV